jgi:hypothetical protein
MSSSLERAAQLTPEQISAIKNDKSRTDKLIAKEYGIPISIVWYLKSNSKVDLSTAPKRGRVMWKGRYYLPSHQP